MRTTLRLDDDVYEAARTLARASSRTLGAVLSELARRGLRPEGAPSPAAEGFPVIDVSDDAEIIPGDRAYELLADEGLE